MKIFIAIISFLVGIVAGTAITVFFVLKKNPAARKYLCQTYKESEDKSQNPIKNLINSALQNNMNNLEEQIKANLEKNNGNSLLSKSTSTLPSSAKEEVFSAAGPGNCKTEDECMKYCSILDHFQECLNFAKTYINDTSTSTPNMKH